MFVHPRGKSASGADGESPALGMDADGTDANAEDLRMESREGGVPAQVS